MGHYDSSYEHEAKLQATKRREELERTFNTKTLLPAAVYTNEELELLIWVYDNTASLMQLRTGMNSFLKLK